MVVLAAGDIAKCNLEWDSQTGALLDNLPGTILGLGDNAYQTGSLQEFNDCYGPTWGRHKDRVYPVPGNHEYLTGGAEGYFTYFGDRATPLEPGCRKECKGYYSFDLGAWHIVALNSEIDNNPGSEQDLWLRADLAAHPNVCTLAYWHKPRWSSGDHGSGASAPLFQAVYDYGVDVVLSGHDHDYERFAPQSPQGVLEYDRGVRQFVVGTGGDTHRGWESSAPNSEVKDPDTWGVLKLTLNPTSYDWEFIPIAGQTFTDSGSANCVTAGSVPPAPAASTIPVSTSSAPDRRGERCRRYAASAATLPAAGLDYVVQSGDTLSLISMRYGLDWEVVAQVNGITNTEVIEIGQVIRLPGVDEAAACTLATTSSAFGHRCRRSRLDWHDCEHSGTAATHAAAPAIPSSPAIRSLASPCAPTSPSRNCRCQQHAGGRHPAHRPDPCATRPRRAAAVAQRPGPCRLIAHHPHRQHKRDGHARHHDDRCQRHGGHHNYPNHDSRPDHRCCRRRHLVPVHPPTVTSTAGTAAGTRPEQGRARTRWPKATPSSPSPWPTISTGRNCSHSTTCSQIP